MSRESPTSHPAGAVVFADQPVFICNEDTISPISRAMLAHSPLYASNVNLLAASSWKRFNNISQKTVQAVHDGHLPPSSLCWHETTTPMSGDWLLLRWYGIPLATTMAVIRTAFQLSAPLARERLVFVTPSSDLGASQLFILLHNATVCPIEGTTLSLFHRPLSTAEASETFRDFGHGGYPCFGSKGFSSHAMFASMARH